MMAVLDVKVRWMIRRDLDDVMMIDRESFSDYWTEDEFHQHLTLRDGIGLVAEADREIVGFMLYRLYPEAYMISRMAVHSQYRHSGVGTAMIDRMKSKMGYHKKRCRIITHVRERNLGGQLFLQRQGFVCTEQAYGWFDGEDAYRMEYSEKH
jgi:ribosomal-protein-alanine N-acetyltransferase